MSDEELHDQLRKSQDPVAKALLKVLVDMADVTKKTNEMYTALAGNDKLKTKGIANFVADHERRLQWVEGVIKWILGAITIITALWFTIKEIVLKILMKTPQVPSP
jgi:hypothetical protein